MATDPAEPPIKHGSKYRFLVSPKWIGFHLLVIVLVVVMINLAFWQIRRLDSRRHFNAEVRANANQPIVPFGDVATAITQHPSTIEWRPVRATGVYVPGHEFLVVNRSQNGDTGRNVIDALQLADGSLLLVNRGFVPDADPVPSPPAGSVEVVGRLRVSEHRTTGQAEDIGTDVLTEIHRVDVGVLTQQYSGATVQPMYVEAQFAATPAFQPIVGPDTSDEGPHLSYTIQWFIFSVCVMVGWVLAVRRSIATRSGKVTKKRRSGYIPIADDESVS
jgi:cytochrome oxidase assembly protein ShyY1